MNAQGVKSITQTPLQTAALVVGLVFLLVGILGFIPGITTNYGAMQFAGHQSEAMLLGLFHASVLHNSVRLRLGVAGVLMARTWASARLYLIGGGIIYLLLFLYGLLVADESAANFVPLNTADDWLHLLLAIGMIGLGALLSRDRSRTGAIR